MDTNVHKKLFLQQTIISDEPQIYRYLTDGQIQGLDQSAVPHDKVIYEKYEICLIVVGLNFRSPVASYLRILSLSR